MATHQGHQQNMGHFGEGMGTAGYQHGQYPEHYVPPPAPLPGYSVEKNTNSDGYHAAPRPVSAGSPGPMILGMKRKVFWVVLSIIFLLLALVVGLGAGLGARVSYLESTQNDAAESNSSAATPTPTSTPSATSTYTPSTASATSSAAIPCPAQNNTLYTANSASLTQFRLYCDVDFGSGEAMDLASVNTTSMEACMDVCASTDQCQGAGWGSTGTVASAYLCYLKTNLTSGHDASDAAWSFAVNLNNTQSVTI